jgi:hypothetical protein
VPAAKRPIKSKLPQKDDLPALRGLFVKRVVFAPEGGVVEVEFFSPLEIVDAEQKRAAAALIAAAEQHSSRAAVEMDDTQDMANMQARIAEAKSKGDEETAAAYQLMYDRAKWEQLSTWSG